MAQVPLAAQATATSRALQVVASPRRLRISFKEATMTTMVTTVMETTTTLEEVEVLWTRSRTSCREVTRTGTIMATTVTAAVAVTTTIRRALWRKCRCDDLRPADDGVGSQIPIYSSNNAHFVRTPSNFSPSSAASRSSPLHRVQ